VLICAAGDIHGAMECLYENMLAFEQNLGARFDWVLHVGDFGIWPDPEKIDSGTRNHDGAGDFSKWLASGRPVPRRTVFIKGNHEDLRGLMRRTVPRCFRGSSIYATDARWNWEAQSVKVSVWVGLVGVMVRPTTDAIRRRFEATPSATTLTTRWSGLQQVRGWTLC
jgi:hypothetical protein